jgi:hypothetical protein
MTSYDTFDRDLLIKLFPVQRIAVKFQHDFI